MQLIRSVTTASPANLLTPEQAAKFLGLSVKTLATWRSTGRHALPFIRCGARIRYQRAELDAWLAKRHQTSTAPRGKS
ncbi:helix-turn-helix domain-containing protein [Pseudomonas putida]|uniref:helix-turn-helix domain-containing protein n=1 Tax=Pseudomonas putida TaxID=303 RepID=UPI0018D7BBCA|nr:helix-turn-helix domain-containing protein [Pseudomonas putida]MBH3417873.1 helix-turn-helix domain-containing protein [Pseudomonas putida]MDG9816075.1 helix-turn-helix domain-containing protein [Pseudomonas putida]